MSEVRECSETKDDVTGLFTHHFTLRFRSSFLMLPVTFILFTYDPFPLTILALRCRTNEGTERGTAPGEERKRWERKA